MNSVSWQSQQGLRIEEKILFTVKVTKDVEFAKKAATQSKEQ